MPARSCLAILMCAVLLGCSAKREPGVDRAAAGPSTTIGPTATSTPGAVEGGPGTTTSGSSGASGPADESGQAAAAAALNGYLDALAAGDFPTALGASVDALRSLAIIRSIVHTGNAERGGVTSSRYEQRSFSIASSTADEVRFSGHASLTSTVSGPSGPSVATTDTFSDMVVRRGSNGWRATGATYNGAPLSDYPAAATAAAGPVQVTLTGALAFGSSLAVVVQLVADGEHTVEVHDDALRIGDEEAPSMTTLVVGGQPGYLYLTYPRRDERPTAWRATVTVDGTAHVVSLAF